MGCWTPVQTTGEGGQWQARLLSADGSRFEVSFAQALEGTIQVDVEIAGRDAFFSDPQHPYSRKLFASLPGAGRRGEELAVICDLPGGTTLMELMDLDEQVRRILPRSYVATGEGLAHWPSGQELLASAIAL